MTNEQKEAKKRTDQLIDELLARSGLSPEAVLGQRGLVAQLTKRVVERALAGELTHHLGYEQGGEPPADNCRNGSSRKTIMSWVRLARWRSRCRGIGQARLSRY